MATGRTSSRKPAQVAGHLRKSDAALGAGAHNCFGCGAGNRSGLRLKFTEDLASGSVECVFHVGRRFEGPPGHVHGGIIATILDEAMGKANRQKGVVALTGRLKIDYLRPVPLGVKLCAVGWPVSQEGRKHIMAGEIRTLAGAVLARSEGLFIAIDSAEMLRKYGTRAAGDTMRPGLPKQRR